MDTLGIDGLQDQELSIEVRIVQPRAYHSEGPIRSWELMGSDLRPMINQLQAAAAEALGNDSHTRAGTQCRYCSARHSCPALQQLSMWALDYVAAPFPVDLDPQGRGLELTLLAQAKSAIDYRISGLEAVAIEEGKKGIQTPGFTVEPSYGRKIWKDTPEEVTALGSTLEIDLSKQTTLTPPQAIKAGMDKDVVDLYTHRPKKGLKLVPGNQKTQASLVFSK